MNTHTRVFALGGWVLFGVAILSQRPSEAGSGRGGDGGVASSGCPADITNDNTVNVDDLLVVITHWGPCPACSNPAQCDDFNPCTTDTCVGGICQHTPIPGCCQTADQCVLPHATAVCIGGQCVISGCSAGFYDCNGIVLDGCESTTPCCNVLKVNEVRTGTNGAFIEVYNACGSPVDIAGWQLVYRTTSGTTDILLVNLIGVIPLGGHFVYGGPGYGGATQGTFTQSLLSTGGGVALRDHGGAIVDSMGWGNATNAFVETAPATASNGSQSMSRSIDGFDTNNNSFDFVVDSSPTPGAPNG